MAETWEAAIDERDLYDPMGRPGWFRWIRIQLLASGCQSVLEPEATLSDALKRAMGIAVQVSGGGGAAVAADADALGAAGAPEEPAAAAPPAPPRRTVADVTCEEFLEMFQGSLGALIAPLVSAALRGALNGGGAAPGVAEGRAQQLLLRATPRAYHHVVLYADGARAALEALAARWEAHAEHRRARRFRALMRPRQLPAQSLHDYHLGYEALLSESAAEGDGFGVDLARHAWVRGLQEEHKRILTYNAEAVLRAGATVGSVYALLSASEAVAEGFRDDDDDRAAAEPPQPRQPQQPQHQHQHQHRQRQQQQQRRGRGRGARQQQPA